MLGVVVYSALHSVQYTLYCTVSKIDTVQCILYSALWTTTQTGTLYITLQCITNYKLQITNYKLHITYYILHITYYILHITNYILHVLYMLRGFSLFDTSYYFQMDIWEALGNNGVRGDREEGDGAATQEPRPNKALSSVNPGLPNSLQMHLQREERQLQVGKYRNDDKLYILSIEQVEAQNKLLK